MVEGAGEVVGVRREAKGGERVWRECPILLIARCLGYWSFPVESNASGRLERVVGRIGGGGRGSVKRGGHIGESMPGQCGRT